MLRKIQDVHCLSQDIFITADLTDQRYWSLGSNHWYHPQQATLFSVAMSCLKIRSLSIDRYTFDPSDNLLAHGRADVMASMSDLTTLNLAGKVHIPISVALLERASQLRSLVIDAGRHQMYPERSTPMTRYRQGSC